MAMQLVECVAQTGSVETPYVRAGQGEPMILLTLDSVTALEGNELFKRLKSEFRVFVPTILEHADADSFSKWLRDFVEALGLNQPHVMVESGAVPLMTG